MADTDIGTWLDWSPPEGVYVNHLAMHRVMLLAPELMEKGCGNPMLVLLVLARHCAKDAPTCWLSYETLAEEAAVSRATAARAISS